MGMCHMEFVTKNSKKKFKFFMSSYKNKWIGTQGYLNTIFHSSSLAPMHIFLIWTEQGGVPAGLPGNGQTLDTPMRVCHT